MLSRLKSFAPYIGLLLGIVLMPALALGQATLLPNAVQSYTKDDGTPAAAGSVDYYVPNTFTRKNTWQDSGKTILNPNPIPLDAAGRPDSNGAGTFGDGTYRQIVKDADGNTIWDAITASTGSGGATPVVPVTTEGIMVGTVLPWLNQILPPKYLYANGDAVSRTTYSQLMDAISLTPIVACQIGSTTISGIPQAIVDRVPIGAKVEAPCITPGATVAARAAGALTLTVAAISTIAVASRIFPWGNGDGATTFNVPDYRALTLTGRQNMPSATAVPTILTAAFYNPAGTPDAVASRGGMQSFQIEGVNLPRHVHNSPVLSDPGHNHTIPFYSGSVSTSFTLGGGAAAPSSLVLPGTSNNSTTGITLSATTGLNTDGLKTPLSRISPTSTVDYIVKVFPDTAPVGPGVTDIQGMTGSIACGTGLTCSGNNIFITSPIPPASEGTAGYFLTGSGIGSPALYTGFLQNGVGAVTRLPYDKMRDTISMKDFGAVEGGDVCAAVAAMVTYANTKTSPYLIMNAGNYTANCRLSFLVPDYTTIEWDANLTQTGTGSNVGIVFGQNGSGMRNIRVIGGGISTTKGGTLADKTTSSIGLEIRNVWASNFRIRQIGMYNFGILSDGTYFNGGVSYNTFDMTGGVLFNNAYQIFSTCNKIGMAVEGYNTENTYVGGNITYYSNYPNQLLPPGSADFTNTYLLYEDNKSPTCVIDNNSYIRNSLESVLAPATTFAQIYGIGTSIVLPRAESESGTPIFNFLGQTAKVIGGHSLTSANIVDGGLYNQFWLEDQVIYNFNSTSGKIKSSGQIQTGGYVVTGLPTCNTANRGSRAYVTDASAPTFNATLAGGGAVITPAFCNGTNWVAN